MSDERVDVGKLLARLGIAAQVDGDEYLSTCPSHADSKPSWSINRHTTKHHCFSCGFGGTAATLILHVLDVTCLAWTKRDAWEWMRSQGVLVGGGELGLDVELYLRREPGRETRALPFGVRVDAPLTEWPTPALRYLERREIPAWQVKRWGAGFAVEGRLAGRVVFPVRARGGALLSYSARSFIGSPVRYLTPHESENPDGAALFGEEGWPLPAERRRVIVVEGAIKALAVERAAGGVVAGLLGATQAKNTRVVGKLATFPEVVVLTDGDRAGEEAADVLAGALARHVRLRRAMMPGKPVDDAPVGEVREALR